VESESNRKEDLWRWLGLTVGGTLLPFGVSALAYGFTHAHVPSLADVLGRGELFIPSSIMNVEVMWIFKNVALRGRSVWYPIVLGACGLAALGGAVCYGIVAALAEPSRHRVEVFPAALHDLMQIATVFSAGEFVEAFVMGTLGVTLLMLFRRKEESSS
jgi:hypothetical protein